MHNVCPPQNELGNYTSLIYTVGPQHKDREGRGVGDVPGVVPLQGIDLLLQRRADAPGGDVDCRGINLQN